MKNYLIFSLVVIALILILMMNKWIASFTVEKAKKSALNDNVVAFLAMIRWSENKAAQYDRDRYRTLYGGSFFNSFAEHPYISGEWLGAKLPDHYCKGAGYSAGCITTAAGGYQFISSTWRGMRDKLGLTDFSPESQDLAAIGLINQRGALALVERGAFSQAIEILKKEWASLPGSNVGQPTNSFLAVKEVYLNNGGIFQA